MTLACESATWRRQFERPQEIGHTFEIGTSRIDFMNDVFVSLHTISAQILTDDVSVHERDTLLVDLAKATFVHQFTDTLQGWVTKCDVRLDDFQHIHDRL